MTCIRVEYDSHVGDCLKVCRMAKDSFGRTTDWEYHYECSHLGEVHSALEKDGWEFDADCDEGGVRYHRMKEKDHRLLKMLARGMGQDEYESIMHEATHCDPETLPKVMWRFRHTTPHLAPFGHNFITFKFQAPVFVMRQIVKHEYIRISELSMRYVRGMPEYFRPKSWRSVADDVKQGSGGDHFLQDYWDKAVSDSYSSDGSFYNEALQSRLAPEQARMFLRLCHMTQGHLSGSIDAIAGLVTKRLDPHAQEETREFARKIERQCREIWPWSWPALMEGCDVNT